MATAIQQHEGSMALSRWREPEDVLAQAQKAAAALTKVIDLKQNKVVFNNETYLEREDWGTVGAFFNCTAKSVETRFVDYGEAGKGFEAVAIVIDRNSGVEIGRAESMCLDTEENWGDVPKYVWKDKLDENNKKIWNQNLRNGKGGYEATKVQEGSSKKPLFQLRSMAQTRAEAKALKGVFSWVVVLAGYKPTPAEELTGHEDFDNGHGQNSNRTPVQQPQRASEKAKQQTAPPQTQAQPAQATQPAQAQPATGKEISGIIEKASFANGVAWLIVKGEPLIIRVGEKNIDSDMQSGAFIKLRASAQRNKNLMGEGNPNGQYWALEGLMELSQVQNGEPQQEPSAEHQATIEGMTEDLCGKQETATPAAVQGMVDSGKLKKASDLPPAEKRPGTIGKKRAVRLDTLCNTNKANNNGFNHDEMKRILSAMPVPVEHLADMEVGLYEQFEKWATGEQDWREFWKED